MHGGWGFLKNVGEKGSGFYARYAIFIRDMLLDIADDTDDTYVENYKDNEDNKDKDNENYQKDEFENNKK